MNTPVTPHDIDDFLRHFDGDEAAAHRAIHAYMEAVQAPSDSATPKVISGKVLLRVENLTKSYKVARQHITALDGVTLDVHEGEFVAITAPSGSGKSTLLQLMGGLEKPTSGNVVIDGVDVNRLSDRKLAEFRGQTIGFIFQFFYLQPFLNVERNIEVPGMFARSNRRMRQEYVHELAETVGIADRLKHLPKELSGGQIQRAAIARALLNKPKVILADEPTGNLDTENGQAIIKLFEEVRAKFGTTVIVATHDPAVAAKADRIITLRDGALV